MHCIKFKTIVHAVFEILPFFLLYLKMYEIFCVVKMALFIIADVLFDKWLYLLHIVKYIINCISTIIILDTVYHELCTSVKLFASIVVQTVMVLVKLCARVCGSYTLCWLWDLPLSAAQELLLL